MSNKQGKLFPKSRHHMPLAARFARFFEIGSPDSCWEWMGCRDSKGYGQIRVDGKMAKAHRIALSLAGRPAPASLEVLHSCDNPACVNPQHLSAGTLLKNQREAWARDRKKGTRKLSPDNVLEIRRSTETQSVLAIRFGVHQSEISRVKLGRRGDAILLMVPVAQMVGG